jgi:glycosyltransferase involved in cell wall biosynthesis
LRLNVGIDASVVASGSGGTRVYALQLLRELVDIRPDWTFSLYLRRGEEAVHLGELAAARNVHVDVVNARPNAWRVQVALPAALERDHIELFHSMGFFLPLRWRGPKIVTVHDLNFLVNVRNWLRGPTLLSWVDLTAQSWLAVRSADKVLTDSESSRGQIIRLMHLSQDRVQVIPLGADPFFDAPPSDAELAAAEELNAGRPFVLFVGILSPQKNLLTLMRAYARSGLAASGVTLMLAGSDREHYAAALRTEAAALGIGNVVVMPGFVSLPALRALYRLALCVVLPSHGEGFGLPLVEGMASGTPILAANRQAIPEVLGDAGVLFEPDDVEALAGLLGRVAGDAAFREGLAGRSRAGRGRFSWSKTAEATAAVYEEVVSRRRR